MLNELFFSATSVNINPFLGIVIQIVYYVRKGLIIFNYYLEEKSKTEYIFAHP